MLTEQRKAAAQLPLPIYPMPHVAHQRRSITVYSVGEALAQNKRCQCTYRPETSNAE